VASSQSAGCRRHAGGQDRAPRLESTLLSWLLPHPASADVPALMLRQAALAGEPAAATAGDNRVTTR
jgi:hypothetical protein